MSILHDNYRVTAVRGFTLTELAIVLGVAGIVLAGIWTAASMVYENNRVKTASTEVLQIVNNWRSVYTSRAMDQGNGTDITPISIQNNFIPQEMLRPGNTTQAFSPWGGQVAVFSYQAYNTVFVAFYSLNQAQCNHAANSVFQTGMVFQSINGTTQWVPPSPNATAGAQPYTPTQIAAACAATNTNVVGVMFPMQ